MAWIIGLVTQDELEKLRSFGWEDEDPPAGLVSEDERAGENCHRTRAFFVDSDVFAVMTGPDWETRPARSARGDLEKGK